MSCFRCLSLLHWDQENILLSFRTFLIAFHIFIYNPTRVYFFVYMAWEESSFFSFLSLFSLRIFNWPNIYHSFPTALQYNLCCKSKILFQGFYSIPSAYRTICKSFKISLDTWEQIFPLYCPYSYSFLWVCFRWAFVSIYILEPACKIPPKKPTKILMEFLSGLHFIYK